MTECFPAREMHSMFALGADYPCKARDRVISGAGLATNAYSCDRALSWRTICFLTVSSPCVLKEDQEVYKIPWDAGVKWEE